MIRESDLPAWLTTGQRQRLALLVSLAGWLEREAVAREALGEPTTLLRNQARDLEWAVRHLIGYRTPLNPGPPSGGRMETP